MNSFDVISKNDDSSTLDITNVSIKKATIQDSRGSDSVAATNCNKIRFL